MITENSSWDEKHNGNSPNKSAIYSASDQVFAVGNGEHGGGNFLLKGQSSHKLALIYQLI